MTSEEELRVKIRQELLTSGKYEEIYNSLKLQLVNSGWLENFKNLTNETIQNDQDLNFGKLLGQLESKGLESVPDSVKIETLKKIKDFLDTIVE